MNPIANQFIPLDSVSGQYFSNPPVKKIQENSDIPFESVLKNQMMKDSELKFSKHASNRLLDRNITLTDNQTLRLTEGVEKAQEKGIRESLVLVDSLAFIVHVPNRTVVTAMDQKETDNNVFTNIDGAVIV